MFNARSLCNKLPELQHVLYSNNFGIVCVTESWLHTDIPDSLLDPEHKYNTYRHDRSSRGGGVCIFVAKHLHCVELKIVADVKFFEIVFVDILCDEMKYRFSVVYRKPIEGHAGTEAAHALIDLLSKHYNNHGPNIVMGDFNCPGVDWTLNELTTADNAESLIHDYFAFSGFTQCITQPTRDKHLLDILCIDEPLIVRDSHTGPAFSTSDHDTIYFMIDAPSGESDNTRHESDDNTADKKFLWSQADFVAMSNFLGQGLTGIIYFRRISLLMTSGRPSALC